MKFSKKEQYFFLDKTYRNKEKNIGGLDLSLRGAAIVIINSRGETIHQELIEVNTKKKNKSRMHDVHEINYKVNGEYSDISDDITINGGEIDHVKRIVLISERIEKILKKFKVNLVGLEGYAFAKGRTGMVFQIGELGGLVKGMLRRNEIKTYIIPPTSLKSYIANNGHAKKPEMQNCILVKYGIAFEDDNEADAYALAQLVLELGEETTLYCMAGGPDAFRRDLIKINETKKKKEI